MARVAPPPPKKNLYLDHAFLLLRRRFLAILTWGLPRRVSKLPGPAHANTDLESEAWGGGQKGGFRGRA